MTAHIIGKVPPPKRGTTFGDGWELFDMLDGRTGDWGRFYRVDDKAYPMDGGEPHYPEPHEPVRPLTVTPTEQPPDPVVTTYEELEPGERFAIPGGLGTLSGGWKTDAGWVSDSGCHYWDAGKDNPLTDGSPVHRVPASVVVHAEPGTLRMEQLPTWEKGQPKARVFHRCSGGGWWLGTEQLRREHLVQLMGEIAAELATDYDQPEPQDEEPTEHMRECAAKYREPAEDRSKPESSEHPGFDERVAEAESEVRDWPAWKRAAADRVYLNEPAEDRSKPAPGWEHPYYARGLWWAERADRSYRKAFALKSCAFGHMWAHHDAQQAGEGEGS